MADNIIETQNSFTKTDAETARQQFCHCCQNEYAWDCEEITENAVATLTCGHLLCLNCIRTQWLESTTQDGTVFCLNCAKRVTLMHLKSMDKQVCDNKINSDEHSLSACSADDSCRVWMLEQKDGIPLQEWVTPCENFVLKLISGTDSCLPLGAITLDNSASVTTDLMEQAIIPHNCNSLSPLKQAHNSEKTAMDYVVNKSSSKTIIGDTNFQNNSGEMPDQTNTVTSPDLNLKSLLQMLERNSLPSLGAGSECNEVKDNLESFNYKEISCRKENQCFKKSQNEYENHEIEVDSPVMAEKHICEEIGVENNLLPVGIVQNGSFVTTKRKFPKMQICDGYIPISEIISTDNYICMTPTNTNMQAMDKVGVECVPQLWLSQTRKDFSHNNSRSRKGRRRKPLLRHCQSSEFVTRPLVKQEHNSQLQLVKLVRQRVHDKRDIEEKEDAAENEEKFHIKTEMTKRHVEDPELAFMKTVDMPSGKRVEDIYVVPSVWISNEKKNVGKQNCSREPINISGSDICQFFPLEGTQRVPLPVYSHGNQTRFFNTCQTPYWRQVQGSFCGSHLPSTPFSNPSRKSLHSSSLPNTNSFKPTQNIYKVIRGHIITTLNAPKLDPVPSLKDLCKSALRLEAVTAISYTRENNKCAYANENHTTVHQSSLERNEASKEMSSEIKTPKEFLDMPGSSTNQEMKLSEREDKSEYLDKFCTKNNSQKDSISQTNPVVSMDMKNTSKFLFFDKTERISDNEDTLPENPLFNEDIKKTNVIKALNKSPNSCDESLQTKLNKCKNTEHQFDNEADVFPTSAKISHVKENNKSLYSTSSTNLKDNNGDCNIPVVSYNFTDTVRNSYITNQKPDSHISDYIHSLGDSGSTKCATSSNGSNCYPLLLEDPYSDDTFEDDLSNLPSLISVAREIRILSSTEPLNKSLANLTAALDLICSAEKSLCNSNFALFRQVKSETTSKVGRLSLCIRKLGDLIVTVGGMLQEWVKETSSRCFKTMGVLTETYNSNILALIELITPYFHHICELIASCHSDEALWNKKELAGHEQSKSLDDHLSMTSWLDNSVSYPHSSLRQQHTLSAFTYANNQQSASPKNYLHQDCDNLLSAKESSDTSLSEPGSTRVSPLSPKDKDLSSIKKARSLATNKGQRKTRVSYPNKKQKKMLNLVRSRNNKKYLDLKFGETNSGQTGMLLPNTVFVKMSCDRMWSEGNSLHINDPQNNISSLISTNPSSKPISFGKGDTQLVEIPTSTSSWMVPTVASDNCQSIPVQLSISDESSKTTSLHGSDLNDVMGDLVVSSVDTSSECSPNKKIKFQPDDVDAYSNIVVALPEGIKIVVSSASCQNEAAAAVSTTNTLQLHESTVGNFNICTTDLQSFQNVFFIHNSENADGYLQLDPDQLSNALLNTFKGNKDIHEEIEIALIQDDQSNTLTDTTKDEMKELKPEN